MNTQNEERKIGGTSGKKMVGMVVTIVTGKEKDHVEDDNEERRDYRM
jgi:hypothetical protein